MKANYKSKMHHNSIIILLLCVVLFSSMCIATYAADEITNQDKNKNTEKKVKVGYEELSGFLYKNENGQYEGAAYDLLQEIAAYNNWDYEFKKTNYSDAEKELETGAIDFFIPYQKTSEREKIYEYSDQVFITNNATLLTLPDSKIGYDDYNALDGAKIGVRKGTRNGERFKEAFAKHGCTIELVDKYTDMDSMISDLKKGKLKAFVNASARGISNCKIVSALEETDSYVIARKGDREYLDKIDSALLKLKINLPTLKSELNEKYHLPENGAYPSLTTEEMDYIKNKKEISVLIDREECDAKGEFKQSSKVMFDEISKYTGLKFKPVFSTDINDVYNKLSDGKADIMYSFNHDYEWAAQHNSWITKDYATFYNKIVKIPDTKEIKKVALVEGSYMEYYIKNHTDYKILRVKSYKAGLDQVKIGNADATYVTSPIGNYYATDAKYDDMSFLTAYDFSASCCMAVSRNSDSELLGILDKAITCIPTSLLAEAYDKQVEQKEVTVESLYYTNPQFVIGLISIILLIICGVIFMSVYTYFTRKKNTQLSVANNAKTDFLSRMSHDMRTPMNGILGMVELCREESDINVMKHNMEQIELSGKYLLNLINDTLDMNKIESGKLSLHKKPTNSAEVFGNVLGNANMLAAEKGVKLNFDLPDIPQDNWIPVFTDSGRLEQIMINVISNAIKFTDKGGTVDLIMRTISVDEDVVKDRYIIKDSGIGMSEEFLPHIFEPFSQEGKANIQREEGTGLGMPIVKQLVDLMGGEISIESKLGEGTTVTLDMRYDVYKGEYEGEPSENVDLSILRDKRILMCEDHPLNSKITRYLLEKKEMIVEHAGDGIEGVEMFKKSKPGYYDGILMDVRMPNMNGIDATKEIRQLWQKDSDEDRKAYSTKIPIIAMTANAFDEDVRNCLKAGMNDHLSKPIDPELMYRKIANALTKKLGGVRANEQKMVFNTAPHKTQE